MSNPENYSPQLHDHSSEAYRAPLVLRAVAAVGNIALKFGGGPDYPVEVLKQQLAERDRVMNAANAALGNIDSALGSADDNIC